MSRASSKIKPILSKFITVFVSAVSLCNAIPLEAAAASKPFQMRRRQINAFVNRDGLKKVALDGVMPASASVVVKPVSATEESALCSYDITILDNHVEYQPSETYPITVEISDAKISDAVEQDHDLSVWHIRDDGTREQIFDFTVKDDTISFDAFGFSVYEVTENPVCTFNFYYPDATSSNGYANYYYPLETGSKDYRQILKDGEKLTVPQLPSSSDKSTFIGWFVGDANGPTANTSFDFSESVTVTENSSVNLYAVFADCAYLIFHDQYDAEKDAWPVVATRRGEMKNGSATIRTDDITVTYDGGIGASDADKEKAAHMIFRGWSTTQVENAGDNGDAELVPETLTISENKDLYPIFSEIRWLSFDTVGGSYIAPQYHDIGSTVTDLPTPKRTGYTFVGWYTDAECTDENKVTSMEIENDTTLHAKWTPGMTHYTVAIWQQQSTDEVNGEPHYDYVASYPEEAETGSWVTVPSKYKKYAGTTQGLVDYHGFQIDPSDDGRKQVAGDGSTVLNVYYNRNVHTFKFYTTKKVTTFFSSHYELVKYVHSFQALYGAEIADLFSFDGDNGVNYDYHYTWAPFESSSPTSIYSTEVILLKTMPDEDITWGALGPYNDSDILYTFHYCLEALDGEEDVIDYNGHKYKDEMQLKNAYGVLYYNDDFWTINGFKGEDICIGSSTQTVFRNDNSLGIGSDDTFDMRNRTNKDYYFFYKRNTALLTFIDSDNNLVKYREKEVKYQAPIAQYVPDDPTATKEGYEFSGWFYDKDCTVPVDFNKKTMPLAKLDIYAGWKPITHLVELDPNGGELQKDQATWYLVEHGGDPIEEYTNATRNYIPSQEGNYYYHYESYDPSSTATSGGSAGYSTSISGADLSVSYAYEPNSYRYAQWYEVDPVTGKETVYKFGEPVMHDTKLRLHWKELTTYHVKYDAGKGVLDTGNKSELDFQTLDGSEYADHASAVITRSAKAPENQNFVGWKIRGDKSGKVYLPGQSFEFTSQFSEIETGTDGKKTRLVTLDAVYQDFDTAKIIYDANGGTIAANADLGAPTLIIDSMKPTYTNDGSTATIGNLLNNSGIRLSDGTGFTYGDYEFIGWSTQPDGSETFFSKESITNDANFNVNVDTNEPTTLYAVWQVKVYFDKNNDNCTWDTEAWAADTTNGKYQYDPDKKQYYTLVNLNSVLEEPDATSSMKSSDKDEVFWFWSTQRYQKGSKDAIAYDFSKTVTGEMTLYGYWDKLEVPIHVVDSSEETLVSVDSWLKKDTSGKAISTIQIKADTNITFDTDGNTAKTYVNVPTGYKYAFLCAAKDMNSVSDEKIVTNISYNSENRCVWVEYKDGTEGALPSDCELYFVYYESPEYLDIGYVELDSSGKLTKVNVSNAPSKTDSDPYLMENKLKPRSYLSTSDKSKYPYYSFAIGDPSATDATGLHIITRVSNADNDRPTLQFRKTWRGYQYTTDGSTWINCGYDIQPYVVYYPSKPVIVTLDEKTIGLAKDMDEEFEYQVVIEEVTETIKQKQQRTRTAQYKKKNGKWDWYWDDWSNNWKNTTDAPDKDTDTETLSDTKYLLSDTEQESFTLFYSEQPAQNGEPELVSSTNNSQTQERIVTTVKTYQRITIIQTPKDDFSTDNSGTGANHKSNLIYTYTTSSTINNQQVTFTNTRKPEVEVHIALIRNGEIVQSDADYRNTTNDIHIKKFPSTNSITLKDVSSGLFKGDMNDYALAGIIYGTEDDSGIVEKTGDISTVSYSLVDSSNTQIFDYYINSGSSKTPLGDQKIYYLYYQKPKIVYVEETSDGLKLIEDIKMGGEPVILDGEVTQWSYLTIPEGESLILSQSAGNYQVPPKLDGKKKNSLIYKWIGVGTGTAPGTLGGVTDSSEDKYMELRINDGLVEYRFSASDDWQPFESAPVVYAVYKAGNDLRITKDVVGQDTSKKYKLEISSEKFDKDSEFDITGYSLDGTTVNTVKPDDDGIISLQIEDATDITIYGLPEGAYVLRESATDNSKFTLSAEVNGVAATVTDDQFTIDLKKDTEAKLKNKIPDVAPTGYREKTVPYAAMASLMLLMVLWILKKRSVQKGVMSDGSSPI